MWGRTHLNLPKQKNGSERKMVFQRRGDGVKNLLVRKEGKMQQEERKKEARSIRTAIWGKIEKNKRRRGKYILG